MWLILGDPGDHAVPWVHQGLARRGFAPLVVAGSYELLRTARWAHALNADGAGFAVQLADGTAIESDAVQGVVNRLTYIPPQILDGIDPVDREYVHQELHAMAVSALASLDAPMFNPASAQALSGAWKHPSVWAVLAARAGLATTPYAEDSAAGPVPPPMPTGMPSVFVIGDQTVGAVSAATASACVRLAEMTNCPLLGIELGPGETFIAAQPNAYLPAGGEPLLDALADGLRSAA